MNLVARKNNRQKDRGFGSKLRKQNKRKEKWEKTLEYQKEEPKLGVCTNASPRLKTLWVWR